MKEKIWILALLALCACQPVKNDLDKYALKGPVAELTVQSDVFEFPYTVVFNENGQIDSLTTTDFDGEVRSIESYVYNDRNQLEEIYGMNADHEIEVRYEYEHDGRFIRECRIYGMNNQEMHRWVHENNGKHIVRTDYYCEGELQYITTKTFSGDAYDEESHTPDGDPIGSATIEFFKTDDKPSRIVGDEMDLEIQYDAKGLPVMSRNVVVNSRGDLQWKPDLEENPCRYYTYEYDERGNWISRAERVHPDSTACAVLRRIIRYQK